MLADLTNFIGGRQEPTAERSLRRRHYSTATRLLLTCTATLSLLICSCRALLSPDESASEPGDGSGDIVVPNCGFQSARLPAHIKPLHYGLFLAPDLGSLSYEGAVQINLQVSADRTEELQADEDDPKSAPLASNQIALHADDALKIDRVWYRALGVANATDPWPSDLSAGSQLGVTSVCRDPRFQLLVVTLERELRAGARGQLHLTFSAPLASNMRGFYRSAYLAGAGHNETHYLAVTQFQATHARKAFPCFDEPALKATYELVLLHQSELEAIANTRPLSQRTVMLPLSKILSSNQTLVHFARTPPMSSYLLAFAVGRFEHLERSLLNGKLRVRIYTVPGRRQEGRLALETACRAILMMQDYFGIEYPLTKLDLLAVPDFEAGAMENWGLVTFRDSQVLYDELDAAPDTRLLVMSTVVHELAHQWFGNLVTMEWWNELWLNEGFATWMEYELLGWMEPRLEMPLQYLLDSHIHALNEDSFRSAHAVRPAQTESPDEIEDLFDAISYNKASAIIRLIHDHLLRPEPFKRAIRSYLSAHQYSSASTRDLSQSLESSTGDRSVGPLLESWLNQAGHPLVSVHLDEARNELWLEQERFLGNAANLSEEEAAQRWLIPVVCVLSDGELQLQMVATMEPDADRTKLDLPGWFNASRTGHWLKLNSRFLGLYRVWYPASLWRALAGPLERSEMHVADRLNLVDEAHSLMLANRYPVSRLLELLSWTGNERHGAVQSSIAGALLDLSRLFEHTELSGRLNQFGRLLLRHLYLQRGGLEKLDAMVSSMDRLGQAALLGGLLQLGEPDGARDALRLFEDSASSGRPLAAFIRRPVYVAVARYGKEVHFEHLMGMLNSTGSREERTRLARAAARATERSRLERLWRWLRHLPEAERALEGDPTEVVSSMLGSSSGRSFVRHLLESELAALAALNGQRPLTSLVEATCIAVGPQALADMSGFFERHKSVSDWASSREFVEQTLDWQSLLTRDPRGRLRAQLDLHLQTWDSLLARWRKSLAEAEEGAKEGKKKKRTQMSHA